MFYDDRKEPLLDVKNKYYKTSGQKAYAQYYINSNSDKKVKKESGEQ